MRQVLALARKEAREHLWFLFAGIAVFFSAPLLDTARECYAARRLNRPCDLHSEAAIGMVVALGGFYALMLAVAATCRDLDARTEIFWRSRPIRPERLLTVKFLVGLAVLLTVTCGVLVMETLVPGSPWQQRQEAPFLLFHTFTLILIYGVSFLLGCLVRQSAKAALLSVVAGVVIYFVPFVLPYLNSVCVLERLLKYPISPTSISYWPWWADTISRAWPFHAAMIAGSAACLVASILAVQRQWRLVVGKKTIVWLLVLTALLIFACGAVQLGSNLTCLAKCSLDPGTVRNIRETVDIAWQGEDGILLRCGHGAKAARGTLTLSRLRLSNGNLTLGGEISLGKGGYWPHRLFPQRLVWQPASPRIAYVLVEIPDDSYSRLQNLHLLTVDLETGKVIHRLGLPLDETDRWGYLGAKMTCAGNLLYLHYAVRPVLVDLQSPETPRLRETMDSPVEVRSQIGLISDTAVGVTSAHLTLPAFEGSNFQDRTGIPDRADFRPWAMEGDLLAAASSDGVTTYLLGRQEGNHVELLKLGKPSRTSLDRILGMSPKALELRNGLAYVLDSGNRMIVYDVRDPLRPEKVGYYAAGGERLGAMFVLPDGRSLLGGESLYLVESPERLVAGRQ